jgi:hypothetical protein
MTCSSGDGASAAMLSESHVSDTFALSPGCWETPIVSNRGLRHFVCFVDRIMKSAAIPKNTFFVALFYLQRFKSCLGRRWRSQKQPGGVLNDCTLHVFTAELLGLCQVSSAATATDGLEIPDNGTLGALHGTGEGLQYNLFLVSLIIATKVMDDHAFLISAWSKFFGPDNMSAKHLAVMEREYLGIVNHSLHVDAPVFLRWKHHLDRFIGASVGFGVTYNQGVWTGWKDHVPGADAHPADPCGKLWVYVDPSVPVCQEMHGVRMASTPVCSPPSYNVTRPAFLNTPMSAGYFGHHCASRGPLNADNHPLLLQHPIVAHRHEPAESPFHRQIKKPKRDHLANRVHPFPEQRTIPTSAGAYRRHEKLHPSQHLGSRVHRHPAKRPSFMASYGYQSTLSSRIHLLQNNVNFKTTLLYGSQPHKRCLRPLDLNEPASP